MSSITLGQVAEFLAWIAGVIGSVSAIAVVVVRFHNKSTTKMLEPINTEIAKMSTRLDNSITDLKKDLDTSIKNLDISQCRNFLVRFLGDMERGTEIDPVEVQRAYDIMEHYTEDLHMNSYIKDRWDEVMNKYGKQNKKDSK